VGTLTPPRAASRFGGQAGGGPTVQCASPVDCIHPTPDEPDYDEVKMLYIDPEECIDCDACVEACPVDACFAEDQLPDEWQEYIQINADYYKKSG